MIKFGFPIDSCKNDLLRTNTHIKYRVLCLCIGSRTNPSYMELHNGLGENGGQGGDRAYYTAVPNTYNIGNTNSNFVNEP